MAPPFGGGAGVDGGETARTMPAMPDADVRLKSNGNYWLAYWPDPADPRKRKAKSLGPKSKLSRRNANALCRQLAVDMKLGKFTTRSDVPRLTEWLETVKAEVASMRVGTKIVYEVASNYLRRFFDHDPRIDRITHHEAAEWRAAMLSGDMSLDNRFWCEPPGETTACKHTRTAKAIFQRAVDRKILTANPFENLKGNAPNPEHDWHQVTPQNMAAILDACPNDGFRALFALARWAGLRRDESRVELRWDDVLWDKNKIVVNARVKNSTTKWRKRVCPIELRDNPTGFYKLLRGWYENAPEGSVGPCDGVPRHNLYIKTEKILNAAGVVYEAPFHACRKCWETELANKFPLHVVVAWLGNTFEVARRHYLRVDEAYYGDEPTRQAAPAIVVFEDGRHKVVPFVPTSGQSATDPQPTP